MDEKEFSKQMCAWIDPDAVLREAMAYQQIYPQVPQMANSPLEIRFPRFIPGDARSIGLDNLIDKFLQNFELPGEYIDLLASKNPQVTKESWDWIAGIRFKEYVFYSDFPPGEGDDTVVLLSDRACSIPLVFGPVDFLVRYTAAIAPLWRFNPGQRRDFFEPSAYSELSVFIESTVAAALGHSDLLKSAEPRSNATVRYGDGSFGFSMVSGPPFARILEARAFADDLHRELEVNWLIQTGELMITSHKYDFDNPNTGSKSKLIEEDGFMAIKEAEAVQTWRNISRWRNECSPYSILRSKNNSSDMTIDTYYGRVFDFPLEENLGIYGITEAMPSTPGSGQATGYHRIPYRKVSAFSVKSRAELDSILERVLILGDGSNKLYRGQSREFTLKRSTNAKEILYGDSKAVEPSLLATSVRSQMPLEAVLPAWCLLMRDFLDWVWDNQLSMPELVNVYPIVNEDRARLLKSLDLHLYAISMAQHYGLPTMGLDVTEKLDVALFFALHQAERSPHSRMMRYRRKTPNDPPGVLYVFAPDLRFRLIHDLCRPRTFGEGRPERQGAQFLFTGWGYHRNAVARHLGLVFNLDPSGDFGSLPSARSLFPDREEDLFGNYLENALEQDWLPKELRKYVEQLYWVSEE